MAPGSFCSGLAYPSVPAGYFTIAKASLSANPKSINLG